MPIWDASEKFDETGTPLLFLTTGTVKSAAGLSELETELLAAPELDVSAKGLLPQATAAELRAARANKAITGVFIGSTTSCA